MNERSLNLARFEQVEESVIDLYSAARFDAANESLSLSDHTQQHEQMRSTDRAGGANEVGT